MVKGGSALLGLDLISALKWTLSHESNHVSPADPSQAPPTAPVMEAKTDPSSVGYVAGFVHKVKVCEDAVPVQQKLR